jgi:CheY-like chemotaxis protein
MAHTSAEKPLDRLLLVDDDADVRNLVCLALGRVGGYVVKACASAREALEAARTFAPDLILLDFMMPEADGVSALKSLRLLRATRETPVVFLTAMAAPRDLARYDALGCLGVIPKPFHPLELADTLEELWGRHAEARRKPVPDELEELRREYVAELPRRVGAMKAAAADLASHGWNRESVESIYRETHRLAGSSGLYRMARLSRKAAMLEEIVKVLLDGPTWPPAGSPVELTTLVEAVGHSARAEARLTGRSGSP